MMNAAEELTKRGLGAEVLPVSKIFVQFRVPRTTRAIEAALWPLRLAASSVPEEVEPEALELLHKQNEECAAIAICAASTSPRFVQRKARPKYNEVNVDALVAEDFAFYARKVTELVTRAYEAANPDKTPEQERMELLLGLACGHFRIDPTAALKWDVVRSTRLVEMYLKVTEAEQRSELIDG